MTTTASAREDKVGIMKTVSGGLSPGQDCEAVHRESGSALIRIMIGQLPYLNYIIWITIFMV